MNNKEFSKEWYALKNKWEHDADYSVSNSGWHLYVIYQLSIPALEWILDDAIYNIHGHNWTPDFLAIVKSAIAERILLE